MDLATVKGRLAQFGYTTTEADDAMLNYIGTTVENSIKVMLNITEIPLEVENIVIDKIVGEFLLNKKSAGMDLGTINISAAKEISEGDTTIKMDQSPGQQLDTFISWLISGRDQVLLSYRRLRW